MKTYLRFTATLLLFALLISCHKTQEKGIIPDSLHTKITIFAGSGQAGDMDGPPTTATFKTMWAIAIDAAGNTYVTDNGDVQIRKITSAGVVSTLADNPNASGSMVFANADGLAIDAAGNFYVSYSGNNCIRKITPDGKTGIIFAGSPTGQGGFSNGTGAAALFEVPTGLTIDPAGNLYVADSGNGAIRKITPAGVVTTIAGTGSLGFNDGPAAQAQFREPYGVALDKSGNIYVADGYNFRIRKISTDGKVSTVAGNGDQGGDNGPAKTASFNVPTGLAVANDGTIYVTDWGNGIVRRITPAGGVGFLGSDVSFYGYYEPTDIVIDKSGTVYVANAGLNQVLKIVPQDGSLL
jgi:sugar lactone lactonase YvrE